jgi:hypothetical protein
MASFVYNRALRHIADGTIQLSTDGPGTITPIGAALLRTNSQASAATNASVISDISAGNGLYEYTGNNSGRQALSTTDFTVTQDDAKRQAEWDSADISWTSLGSDATAGAAAILIFSSSNNDTNSVPIAYIDLTNSFQGNGGDVTVQWNSDGILNYRTG